jgi:hypothetical protein
MIPTLIVAGLLVGLLPRSWYLIGLGSATIAWPLLLIQSGIVESSDAPTLLNATALAALNVSVGLLVATRLGALWRNRDRAGQR